MAAAIPYGIMGGQAIYGYIKNRQAAKQEQQARAQEQQMLTGATGVSNQLTQSGTNLTAQGMPGVQQAGSYYSSLLGGNRAQMAEATAGGRGAITDQYRGAERGLERSGIRGAAGDLAKAELNRDRVGKVAGLTTGVQGQAANNLADLSSNMISQGGSRLANAGSLWSNLLGNRSDALKSAQDRHGVTGPALGGTIFDLLNQGGSDLTKYLNKRKGGGYGGVGSAGYPGDATSGVNNPLGRSAY